MIRELSLDALWESARSSGRSFQEAQVAALPEGARRYLLHAIAQGTELASAVRLRMHGEIKLRRWLPFTAQQVIDLHRGMIWSATVRMRGMAIRGSDRLVDGAGAMKWKLFGIIPIMKASGPEITRSAIGRVQAESVWLPSVFSAGDVSWQASESSRPRASFETPGERTELALTLDDAGGLLSLKLPRWGNPEGAEFHLVDFGGVVEQEGTFCGYTIPTRLRIGWYFDTDRFETEGEFFRVTIDDAAFR